MASAQCSLPNRSTRRRVRSSTCSSTRSTMAVLYYGVLARSEKCVCARQSNGAKKRRRNSRKVRQGSLRQSLYYIRKRWQRRQRRCGKLQRCGMRRSARQRLIELAAACALKKQQCDAATLQKSRNTLNKGKRAASQNVALKPTKKHCIVSAASGAGVEPPPPQPPSKTTMCGRHIKVPQKFK
jgi:hypothetical protein